MAITSPVYCTREDVKSALDIKDTFRNNAQVDRAIMSAATDIYGMLHRRFYPEDGIKYWDWPNYQGAAPWRIWFDQYDLVTATQVTAGGVAIPLGNIFFEPVNKEADEPYEYLELDRSTSAAFSAGGTPQRDVGITGTWGYCNVTAAAGSLAAAVTDTTGTSVTVSDSSLIGAGQIILIGSERMLVTDRAMNSTGTTLAGNLTSQNNAVAVPVSDGTAFHAGETILIDSERMLVTDITSNTLTAKRAWDGSVLAAHTSGVSVYAPRLLTVTRGALGTTAATHTNSTAVAKNVFPGLVVELAVGLALNTVLQETSGYARTVGAGDNVRNASGAGLANLTARTVARYGRKARSRVI